MVAILMMPAKLATLSPYKIMVLWNKGYDMTISVHYATNKYLSHESNFIVDLVLWALFYKDLTRKNNFLRSAFGSSSLIWDLL